VKERRCRKIFQNLAVGRPGRQEFAREIYFRAANRGKIRKERFEDGHLRDNPWN
jgi:hypothetical protein